MVKRGVKFTMEIEFVTETCCACGIVFAVPRDLEQRLRAKRGLAFYCPAGHGQHYTAETPAQRLQREVDRLKQREAMHEDEKATLRREQAAAEERAAKAERARKRVEARVQNGVCPDCNRSFVDLRRHMVNKHGHGPKCEVVALPKKSHA